jgi:glycosyltransferase involved in cell wall biosynthesis
LRIAIDARELAGKATGVGRYLAELLAIWRSLPAAAAYEFVELTPSAGEAAGTAWEQVTLPRLLKRVRPDVLFAPGYTGPIWSRVPMVLTIHDVSFAAHPEWFSPREGLRRRVLTRLAARRASRIVTVSDFSKQEIVRHLGVLADKVDVIYSGVRPIADGSMARTSDDPLVLYVGSIFNRRHVPELIDGFTRMAARHRSARLELVGDNRTHPWVDIDALIAHSPAAARIRARAYVSDAELAALYGKASALAFLSDYEGFGFTPLEALSADIPPLVLDTPVAREIYGPAAVYVGSPDPAHIERGLERILFDEPQRAAIRDVASTVLRRYSWTECAHRTLQVLVAAAR